MEFSNEDNMVLMKRYENDHFDLAIVDPPYGISATSMEMGGSKNSSGKLNVSTAKKARFSKGSGKLKDRVLNKSNLDWDTKPNRDYFKELFRVSKNQIIFGGNYFDLPPTRCIICWDKIQPWDNFSQWEMAWTSFDRSADIVRISTTGGSNKDKKFHPTQKPIKLYEWLLDRYAKEGDKILDTHLGSGSIAIACHYRGFDLTACELDEEYFNLFLKRFELQTMQQKLF